jgi:hypothetical protein
MDAYAKTAAADFGDSSHSYNALVFVLRSLLSKFGTIAVVEVVSVGTSGGLGPAGFVDIRPCVNQVDGAGNPIPHNVIYQCPFFRLSGGGSAVICDPQAGDLGLALIADRDASRVVSAAVANQGGAGLSLVANPGSWRMFDYADAFYLGGFLPGTPKQFVMINASGITVEDNFNNKLQTSSAGVSLTDTNGNSVKTQSSGIAASSPTQISLAVGGKSIVITSSGITLDGILWDTHYHTEVQSGSSNTGGPA